MIVGNSTAQDFWLAQPNEAQAYNAWVMDQVAPSLGGRVLEIGCGVGSFTVKMAARGHAVTAVDIDPNYVTATRQRLADHPDVAVLQGDATAMDWRPEFDTVLMLDVLEHIEDDVGFIRRLGGALRPGGSLVLKVPAGPWLFGPMDRAIGHYRRYTERSLVRAYQAGGYTLSWCRPFNAVGMLGWFVNGRLFKRTTPPAMQVSAFDSLLPVVKLVDRLNPLPFGLSLIAAGRKSVPAPERAAE